MKTAEEIFHKKLKRLEGLQWRLYFSLEHEDVSHDFYFDWVHRLDNYKINILNSWKSDICKKPHELLQKCLDDNYELGNGRELKPGIRDEIEKYLNAPEPE